MRTIIVLTTFLLLNTDLFSQGGVNVKYIPIDSIDEKYVGQEIKIDFKSKKTKDNLIQKTRLADTVKISLNNRQIDLIEVKGRGTDYWYFDKEYLKSYNYQRGQILRINDIEIQKIETDSILTRMTLVLTKNEKQNAKQINKETKDFWIPKDKIEGVLIKK